MRTTCWKWLCAACALVMLAMCLPQNALAAADLSGAIMNHIKDYDNPSQGTENIIVWPGAMPDTQLAFKITQEGTGAVYYANCISYGFPPPGGTLHAVSNLETLYPNIIEMAMSFVLMGDPADLSFTGATIACLSLEEFNRLFGFVDNSPTIPLNALQRRSLMAAMVHFYTGMPNAHFSSGYFRFLAGMTNSHGYNTMLGDTVTDAHVAAIQGMLAQLAQQYKNGVSGQAFTPTYTPTGQGAGVITFDNINNNGYSMVPLRQIVTWSGNATVTDSSGVPLAQGDMVDIYSGLQLTVLFTGDPPVITFTDAFRYFRPGSLTYYAFQKHDGVDFVDGFQRLFVAFGEFENAGQRVTGPVSTPTPTPTSTPPTETPTATPTETPPYFTASPTPTYSIPPPPTTEVPPPTFTLPPVPTEEPPPYNPPPVPTPELEKPPYGLPQTNMTHDAFLAVGVGLAIAGCVLLYQKREQIQYWRMRKL